MGASAEGLATLEGPWPSSGHRMEVPGYLPAQVQEVIVFFPPACPPETAGLTLVPFRGPGLWTAFGRAGVLATPRSVAP